MRHNANRRDVMLVGTIESYMKLYNISDQQMADAIGCCQSTWFTRKKSPGKLTLTEIERIMKRLQIPAEEMKERLF